MYNYNFYHCVRELNTIHDFPNENRYIYLENNYSYKDLYTYEICYNTCRKSQGNPVYER